MTILNALNIKNFIKLKELLKNKVNILEKSTKSQSKMQYIKFYEKTFKFSKF